MNRVRIGKDGPQPAAFCPACGRRLGEAYGPSASGQYAMSLDATWHRDYEGRVWRKSRYRGRRPGKGVQASDQVECPCGERLAPP